MNKTKLEIFFMIMILVLLACGQGMEESSTEIPSRTPYPSPTTTPTVRTVCVQVNAGDFSDEITQMTHSLLADLGLEVISNGSACDATLFFDLTLKALSEWYTNLNIGPGARCFTGAIVTGTCTYSIAGYTPLTLQVEKELPPESGVISFCPGPDETMYIESIWPDAVFSSFHTLWGDEFIFAAAGDENPSIRAQSIGWLKTIGQDQGPQAERAITAIFQACQSDQAPGVRRAALNALASMGLQAEMILPTFVESLSDADPKVRQAAADAIGSLGEEGIGAIPALILVLQDPDTWVRYGAAGALGKIGPGAEEAVPALIILLEDEEFILRNRVITTLGEIGPGAMQAVPALIKSLLKEEGIVKDSTVESLIKISGQDFGEDAAAWQQWWDTQK